MNILVINSGSSSIKFSIFDASLPLPASVFEGELEGIGTKQVNFSFRDANGKELSKNQDARNPSSCRDAIRIIAEEVLQPGLPKIQAVGYRVVHPGAHLKGHRRITSAVLRELRAAAAFAPLHDPAALEIIEEWMKRLPDIAHYACFDTVFHQTMAEEATVYALPDEYRAQGVRRYGFHGLSCESVVAQLRRAADTEAGLPRRLIVAHLGSGCSVTAILEGRSIDTSMGLTPTGGVVMGTRPGDLDPGLLLYLLRQQRGERDAAPGMLESLLNHSSGIVALSGLANDVRLVRQEAAQLNRRALLAMQIFTRSIKKAIGSYVFLLGGVDAMVFTGGIGEHDSQSRSEILSGLEGLGIALDGTRNQTKLHGCGRISAAGSAVSIFVVPSEEDRMIACHVAAMERSGNPR
jgi:acetate kinase